MGRVPQTTKVQAMIDAAGVGNGANIKSGVATGPPLNINQVDFATPFVSIPNVVITPVNINWGVQLIQATTAYFKWKSKTYTEDIIIHWIATTAGNS